MRGVVKDEAGNVLQNVTILQHKTGYVFKSGSEGTFGIAINQQIDTFSFSLDGYQKEKIVVNADNYINAKLKKLSGLLLMQGGINYHHLQKTWRKTNKKAGLQVMRHMPAS